MATRHKITHSTSSHTKDGKAGEIRYNPWDSPELALKGITGIQRVEGASPVPVRTGAVFSLWWFVGGTEDHHFVPYSPRIGQPDALIYAGFSFSADKTQSLLDGTKWRISDIPFTLQIPVTFPIPEADATGLFRADIIYVDYNGQAHYEAGEAGATAVAPELPLGHILVTTIYVSLTETVVVEPPIEYPDVQYRTGEGNPLQSLGNAGDSYLNNVNGEIWFKTLIVDGVATWEKKYTPVGGATSFADLTGNPYDNAALEIALNDLDADIVTAQDTANIAQDGVDALELSKLDKTLLNGGTTGQVLSKVNNTNLNFEWKTPSAGGVTQATGTLITFTQERIYGTILTPETGNITADVTGALLGTTNVIIHNTSSAPTFDSKFKMLSGSDPYITSMYNYIFVMYVNPTEILYTINQRT